MHLKASKKKMDLKRNSPERRRLVRKLKASVSLFMVAFLIVGGIFSYVWPRLKFMTLIYDYNNLQTTESKLKKLGIPASCVAITALIISIVATELGVCN